MSKHFVWVDNTIHLVLDDAEWYDTAVPWRYYAAKLLELDALATTTLRIESAGDDYLIDGRETLLAWVEAVFEKTHSQRFGQMLRSHYKRREQEAEA